MAVANSDIAQLCAELILLWQQFMELACRREQVRRSLARQHHTLRVGGGHSTTSRVPVVVFSKQVNGWNTCWPVMSR